MHANGFASGSNLICAGNVTTLEPLNNTNLFMKCITEIKKMNKDTSWKWKSWGYPYVKTISLVKNSKHDVSFRLVVNFQVVYRFTINPLNRIKTLLKGWSRRFPFDHKSPEIQMKMEISRTNVGNFLYHLHILTRYCEQPKNSINWIIPK